MERPDSNAELASAEPVAVAVALDADLPDDDAALAAPLIPVPVPSPVPPANPRSVDGAPPAAPVAVNPARRAVPHAARRIIRGTGRALWRTAYRALDLLLTVLNWPFGRLSPEARHGIGLAAIASLAMSLLALLLVPLLRG